MSKFTITATISFEVEAVNDSHHAAMIAKNVIKSGATPDRIDVWHQDGTRQFADRYRYDDLKLIEYKRGQPATVQISETVQQLTDGTPYTPPVVLAKGKPASEGNPAESEGEVA